MLYLEDYLELIEHLPQETADRLTDMRELDLEVQNSLDNIEKRTTRFFQNAYHLPPANLKTEHNNILREYIKILEDSEEKVQLANCMTDSMGKYMRRLDQDILKFKMELETDNCGITEILEKRLEGPDNVSSPVSNVPPISRSTRRQTYQSAIDSPNKILNSQDYKRQDVVNVVEQKLPKLSSPATTPHSQVIFNVEQMGAGGSAIAAAASQAIAATQQMQQGRRTASLKASYEAINSASPNFSRNTDISAINKELSGAAQTAIAAVQTQKRNRRRRGQSEQNMAVETSAMMEQATSASEAGEDAVMEADPDEPRYCICNEVAFGDMVACDNKKCPYEWYHYPCVGITSSPKGKCQEHWRRVGRQEIETALRRPVNWRTAKNVIVLVGDGMDPNTITASRIHQVGEDGRLSFENFPHLGILKTYSTNKKVPDAAASGTALFTGVKTKNGMVGVDVRVRYEDCMSSLPADVRVESIMKWAQEAGKGTGFVTNNRVTDATVSALYAHSASRYWECNDVSREAHMCKDIGRQLMEDEPGRSFNVIFGGGRQSLMTDAPYTSNDKIDEFACTRTDKRNLIENWLSDKAIRNVKSQYIRSCKELLELDSTHVEYALGIFANSFFPFESERNKSLSGQPSLELMVEPAIKMLRKHWNGFVLVVEGGLIDKAHHEGHARKAVEETLEFDKAVKKTMQVLHDLELIDDTLVIVTGGHGHTMSINGYPNRNESIFGIADISKHDNVPYTTLTYATGSAVNFQYNPKDNWVARENPTWKDTTDLNYAQQAAILTDKETHGGGDVTVYATGPMAHLFHGVHEETYVAHVIAYAARIGPFRVNSAFKTAPALTVIVCSVFPFLKIY